MAIKLEKTEKFEKLAKKYPIKYRESADSTTSYEIDDKDFININKKLVADCLYANVPKELRVKGENDIYEEREI